MWCLYSFQIMLFISSLLYPFYPALYSQEFVLQSSALCLPCLCVVIHTSFVICWVVCSQYDQFIIWNPGNIYILEIFCPTSSLNLEAVYGIAYFYDIDLSHFTSSKILVSPTTLMIMSISKFKFGIINHIMIVALKYLFLTPVISKSGNS